MQQPHCRSMLTAQLQCFNTQPSQARVFYTQKYIYPASPYCLPVAHFTRVTRCHSLLFTYLIYSRLAHFTLMSLWSLMMSASHVTKPLTESQSQLSLRVPTPRPALISPSSCLPNSVTGRCGADPRWRRGPGVSTRVHPDNIDTAASVSTQGPDLGLACNAGPASDTAALRCTSQPSLRGKQRTWARI